MNSSTFSSLSLSQEILEVVTELGFARPTPIQTAAIPILLAGRDLIGQSKTGSGKTAAFALPILQKIDVLDRSPQALILCPTRELAVQVAKDFRRLGRRFEGLRVLTLSGGESLRDQVKSLENGVAIIVGTPGRILDLIHRRCLNLDRITVLVMDEADKMLDMGFNDEISNIMEHVPQKRQTVFFSATFPDSIARLSQKYQTLPQQVIIEDDSTCERLIEQFLYEVVDDEKPTFLIRALQQHPSKSTLIFCRQKKSVDELVELLKKKNVSCAALHGDLDQRNRDKVMTLFRNGSQRILIATDVAARGLDIDHLDLVVNYDLPHKPEIYIHRIGRTGRAGRAGCAITLATMYDEIKISEIEKFAGFKFVRRPLGFKNQHGLAYTAAAMQTLFISGGRKDKLRPGDILGALTGVSAGLAADQIGKIEVLDRCSYVAVSSAIAATALTKLREGRIKGHKFQIKMVDSK